MIRIPAQAIAALVLTCACGGLALAQGARPAGLSQAEREAAAAREEAPPGPADPSKVVEPGEPAVAAPVKIEAAPQTPAAPLRPAAPSTRARFPIAVVQVVDKITTETNRFEVRVDHPVQYRSLIFTLQACEASAPDELDRDYVAHMQVDFQPATPEGHAKPARQAVFKGWMYASSPSISPLEHPVYDAWLIACKGDGPAAPPPAPPKPVPLPKAAAEGPGKLSGE